MTDGSLLRSRRVVLILALASTLAIVGCAINLSPAKTNPLTSITVSPAGQSVALGLSQQFAASGTYSNGNQKDLTSSVTWTSSSPSSVSVSSAGLAQTLAAGQVTITATSGSVSGSAVFTVDPAAVVSVAVTPLSPAVVAGAQQQFTASAIYTDNTSQDVTTQAVWNSSLSNVATVSATGLATSIVPGITNVVATWNSVSGGSAFSAVSTPSTPVELNGSYAFSYTTLDTRGAAYVAGSFHANPPDASGNGVIDSGQQDTNTSAGITNVVLTGTYHIYPDGRGTMVLTPGGGAGVTFEFILAASGTTANFVEFDGNATAAGSFDLQDASAFNAAALAGNLVFRLSGIDASANPMGEVGVFTADGAGNVTAGSVDVNDFGVNLATASLTGTYSVASNGRGLLTLNNGTSSSNFTFYVVEAGRLNLIASDALPALSGITELQAARSFSNADLSQGVAYLLNRAPSATAASFDVIGRAILDGAGNITGGDQDEVSSLGAQNAITGGTYSIDASGRGTISALSGSGNRTYTVYMMAKNRMSMLETFSSASGVGAGVSQVAIMTDGVLAGSYALATVAFGTNDTVQVLRLLPDGNGNITGLVDLFNKGAASSIFINGTYNVTGNGRTTLTTNVGIGVQTLIFYVASGTESFALGTQPAVEGTMFLQ